MFNVVNDTLEYMAASPIVSVILTCFNREEHIGNAIQSVLNQTLTDFELIIVDDASTDLSWSIITSFNDPRILAIRKTINGGQNSALNEGIAVTRGQFVSFLDSDDEYLPNFLEEFRSKFNSSSLKLGFIYSYSNGDREPIQGCNKYAEVLSAGRLSGLGMLFVLRQAVLEIYPLAELPEIFDMCQDDRIYFELAKRNCFAAFKSDSYKVGKSHNQVSANYMTRAIGWDQLFIDYRVDILSLCGVSTLQRHLADVAVLYLLGSNPKTAFKVSRDAIRLGGGISAFGNYIMMLLKRIYFRRKSFVHIATTPLRKP